MISLIVKLTHNPLLLVQLFDRMKEGGMFFMFPIFSMLLLVLFLIIKSVLRMRKRHSELQKNVRLLNSIGLLAVVWGMLGQLIGVIGVFDQVDMIGEISAHVFAGGLKVSALPPVFGFIVFIVSRIASIIFIWIRQEGG